ncbi:hypothetical protein, partial [Campylobacter sp. MG1]|uniref:hypothetical protein n=1 Tax=Campylobacter sp. MG1 TaxID=2976332 RepID=UPI00226C7350
MNKKIKLSLLAFTLITNAYSQDTFPSTTQNSDIEINNKLLESGSRVISNGSINVTNNSIIKGDLTASNININNSTIDSGNINSNDFLATTTIENNSIVNGGNFTGDNIIIKNSTINNGNFFNSTTIEDNTIVNDGVFNGDLTIKSNKINGGDFNNLSSVYFDGVDINNKLNFTTDRSININNSNLGENIEFDSNSTNNTYINISNSTISSKFNDKYDSLSLYGSIINTSINVEYISYANKKNIVTKDNIIIADRANFGNRPSGYKPKYSNEFDGNLYIKDELIIRTTIINENSHIKTDGITSIFASDFNGTLESSSKVYILHSNNLSKNSLIKSSDDIYVLPSTQTIADDKAHEILTNSLVSGTIISDKNIIINDRNIEIPIFDIPSELPIMNGYSSDYIAWLYPQLSPDDIKYIRNNPSFSENYMKDFVTIKDANLTADKINIIDTLIEGTNNIIKANETILQSGKDKEITLQDNSTFIIPSATGDVYTIKNTEFINNTNQTNEVKISGDVSLVNGKATNVNFSAVNNSKNSLTLDSIELNNVNIDTNDVFDNITLNNINLNTNTIKANDSISINNNSIIKANNIDTNNLTTNDSHIYANINTNNLNANNTNFYLYGGGNDTSLNDKFSGPIIVNEKASGGNNKIIIANTDLSLLKDKNVPIAIINNEDELKKDYFSVVYRKSQTGALVNYKLSDDILHFNNIENNNKTDNVWSLGFNDNVDSSIKDNIVSNVNIDDIKDETLSNKFEGDLNKLNTYNKDNINDFIIFDSFNEPVANVIKTIIYSPYYTTRYYIDDTESRFTYLRNNETNKGFWINTDYNYLETNTNNLKANRVYIGVDNKLDFN